MFRIYAHWGFPRTLPPPSLSLTRGRVCIRSYQAHQQQEEELISWVRQNGGHVHPSLRLSSIGNGGMGLIATQPLVSGTLLITLPPHLPLSLPTSPASSSPDYTLAQLTKLVPDELWALKLGLKVLMERAHTGSFWWPYICNLPQRFNVPFFFTGPEITNLQYPPVIYQVKRRCRALLDLEKEARNILTEVPSNQHPFGGQEVNASSLGWAMAAVSSRAFQMHNSKGSARLMLPLIDMCNHSFSPNARIIQQESKEGTSFSVIADCHLEEGADILLSYGALSNDVLLLDYGFVVADNPHDFVEMRYDKAMLDAARMAARLNGDGFSQSAVSRQSILEQLNLEGPSASLQVNFGGPKLVDGRLLAALRVLYAQDSDYDSVQQRNLSELQMLDGAPLGDVIEKKALKTLVAICALLLGHFPTSVTEDESILKKVDLTEAGRLALEYRVAKKKLLVDCIRALSRRITSLEKDTMQ